MSDESIMVGGCMCGAVRYKTSGEPFQVSHCHCRSCRRHNGASLATLAGYKTGQVTFSGDQRRVYESSPGVGRGFCGNCGTPLTWEGNDDDLGPILELHTGTFDDPGALVPTGHAFEPERIPWLDIADNLPRFEGFVDYSPVLRHGPVSDGLPGT